MAGIPVRSGDADLTASGTPVRSAVQVQNSLRETDGLEKVTDFSRNSVGKIFGSGCSGIFGLVELGSLGVALNMLLLKFFCWELAYVWKFSS